MHVVFEPLDFMARLAALVPRPRMHLTRFHGGFAPPSTLRAQVTPGGRRETARSRDLCQALPGPAGGRSRRRLDGLRVLDGQGFCSADTLMAITTCPQGLARDELAFRGVPCHVGDIAYADEDDVVLMPASA